MKPSWVRKRKTDTFFFGVWRWSTVLENGGEPNSRGDPETSAHGDGWRLRGRAGRGRRRETHADHQYSGFGRRRRWRGPEENERMQYAAGDDRRDWLRGWDAAAVAHAPVAGRKHGCDCTWYAGWRWERPRGVSWPRGGPVWEGVGAGVRVSPGGVWVHCWWLGFVCLVGGLGTAGRRLFLVSNLQTKIDEKWIQFTIFPSFSRTERCSFFDVEKDFWDLIRAKIVDLFSLGHKDEVKIFKKNFFFNKNLINWSLPIFVFYPLEISHQFIHWDFSA